MKGDVYLNDLSPDGRWLLYFAAQRHRRTKPEPAQSPLYAGRSLDRLYSAELEDLRKKHPKRKIPRYKSKSKTPGQGSAKPMTETWTAISRPPFFTALALWPAFGTWTGGGLFDGKRGVRLFEDAESLSPHLFAEMPKGLSIESLSEVPENEWVRSALSPHDRDQVELQEWRPKLEAQGLTRCDWVMAMPDGTIFFSGDGQLYQSSHGQADHLDISLNDATVLADFTGCSFELMEAPEDMKQW